MRREPQTGELSHVGMSLCFFCNESKETLLDRRLRNTLPREAVYNHEPCDKCKEWMKQGIILISADSDLSTDRQNPYRSGGWVVVTEDAARRYFKGEALEAALRMRIAFVEDSVWMWIGLPYGDVVNDDPSYGPAHKRDAAK